MAEVFNFLECYLYRVGTTGTDTTETSIDAYAQGVTVNLNRELMERVDQSGVVQDRVPIRATAEMSIAKLYSEDPFLLDGNNIKVYFQNVTGTDTYTMTNCWWTGKGWSGASDDTGCRYDLTIVGGSFGT